MTSFGQKTSSSFGLKDPLPGEGGAIFYLLSPSMILLGRRAFNFFFQSGFQNDPGICIFNIFM
jgi:hypothetical protein